MIYKIKINCKADEEREPNFEFIQNFIDFKEEFLVSY